MEIWGKLTHPCLGGLGNLVFEHRSYSLCPSYLIVWKHASSSGVSLLWKPSGVKLSLIVKSQMS